MPPENSTPASHKNLWNVIPIVLFGVFVIAIGINAPQNDLTRYFLPAGRYLLDGQSPYIINRIDPFLYWPIGLWVFPPLVLIPGIYHFTLLANAVLLVVIVRRLNISPFWLLYPPALYCVTAGQLDLLVLWLGVEAYLRRKSPLSGVALAIGLALKPQAALFWVLPWLWGMENWRKRLQFIAIGSVVFLAPVLIWALFDPNRVIGLWQAWWLDGIRVNTGAYVGDSPSFWAAGFPVLALVALVGWLIIGRSEKPSRPLLALGLPALRYYSTVALLGAVPVWGVALGYVTVTLTAILKKPVFWIEPLVMIGYWAYIYWQRREKNPQTLSNKIV